MSSCVYLSYVGLGANLLHLPYCHEIAKKDGPVTIVTLCKNLAEALEDDPNFKCIIYLQSNHKKISDIFKLSSFLKNLNFNKIYIFYPSPRLFIAAKLAGIKKIFHYPLFKKEGLHLVNAAKSFTCESLGIDNCPTETEIIVNEEKLKINLQKFDRSKFNIVIGAGSSGPDTKWGEKNFSDLMNKLNDNGNFFFYLQSGLGQNSITRNVIKNVKKKNIFDLSNLSIREIFPYLKNCDMYVGNDTFVHHVTSQSKKPSIIILLNTPKAYSDYSKFQIRIIPDNKNLEDLSHISNFKPESISVEKVFNKVMKLKDSIKI